MPQLYKDLYSVSSQCEKIGKIVFQIDCYNLLVMVFLPGAVVCTSRVDGHAGDTFGMLRCEACLTARWRLERIPLSRSGIFVITHVAAAQTNATRPCDTH